MQRVPVLTSFNEEQEQMLSFQFKLIVTQVVVS